MTEIDRAQLAALDASGMHNTGCMAFEYGEFDTVKTACKANEDFYGWECDPCEKGGVGQVVCAKDNAEVQRPDLMGQFVDNLLRHGLIETRSKTHGDFSVNSQVSQAIKRAIRTPKKYMELHDFQKEAIDAIAGKIGRIIAGDAGFDDHWQDIAGYAELVRERLVKMKPAEKDKFPDVPHF